MTKTLQSAPAPAVEIAVADAASAPIAVVDTGRTITRAKKSLADYERAVHHYPEPIRGEVRWLQAYLLRECQGNGSSLRALACKAGWDRSEEWFYNLLGGYNFKNSTGTWKEGGNSWSQFLEMMSAIRRHAENAARQGRQQFVITPTYRCLCDFIDARRALNAVCKFGGITGATGSQKTRSLKNYALLNNHGTVILVEAPANNNLGVLQRKIAERYNVEKTSLRLSSLREAAIRQNVNETRTIMIDNAQRLYIDGKGSDQPCFNWLLELQEDTGCTIILSFTTDFCDTLTAGRARGFFEQFIGRMGGMQDLLRLPDHAPESDLRVIARAFGLEPGKGALDYLHRWSREAGRIRIVFSRLQRAQQFAKLDGRERITLADLEEAHTWSPPAYGTDTEEEG